VSLQQGEAALQAIQNSTRQLDDDVKDAAGSIWFLSKQTATFLAFETGLRFSATEFSATE
jgi:hypothetical protein